MFRNNVGVGFKEWTDYVRIQKAIEVMLKEDQSLTAIGLSVGFESCTTFQRQFKKHARMRPRDFKRAIVNSLGDAENLPA
jgi:YesN/AraC family two-component response regulator